MNEKALEDLYYVPLSDIFIVFVIAVAVRAVVSHLLNLKAVVRNKFLTTDNSHQLHSLLLTL